MAHNVQLTLQDVRNMPEDDYMNEQQLAFFHHLLTQLRLETFEEIESTKQELSDNIREPDIVDIASLEDERMRKLRFVDRKIKYIRKIDQAIERIRRHDYGYCEQSGYPIGIERLILRPTATLSVEAKQHQEAHEIHYKHDRNI